MNHLKNLILREQKTQKLTAKVLAEKMGIDPVILSRIKSGKQRFFEFKTLRKMIRGISENSFVRNEFLAAYFEDLKSLCTEVKPEELHILLQPHLQRIQSPALKYGEKNPSLPDLDQSAKQSLLDHESTEAIRLLIQEMGNNNFLRNLICDLAQFIRKSNTLKK